MIKIMPRFLEQKLKKEYGAKSDIPYKIMNKMGYMHGSKETKRGEEAEERHAKSLHEKRKKMAGKMGMKYKHGRMDGRDMTYLGKK